jgi:hypothetical protein
MKRVMVPCTVVLCTVACFDFDGSYTQYCSRNNCGAGTDGGNTAGGNTAGGNTAGGNTAGGNTAGGNTAGGNTAGGNAAGGNAAGGNAAGGNAGGGNAAGGNAAGGNAAGGNAAGGNAAGGNAAGGNAAGGNAAGGNAAGGNAGGGTGGGMAVDAGQGDAGVQCVGEAFCIFRQTQRTDFKGADAIVGTRLDSAAAIFSKYSTPVGSIWVTHGSDPTPSSGNARPFSVGSPGHSVFGGTPFDFLVITETSMTNARIQRVIDGGLPQVRFSGTCQSTSFYANTYERTGNRVFIGGRNEAICELNLMTGQTMLVQPENGNMGTTEYVNDLYVSPGDEVFWATSDGYIGKLGVGRITGQIDPTGIVGIDGIDANTIWAVGDQSIVATRGTDGGFDVVGNFNALSGRSYSLKVTPDGIFIGAFGGVMHRTRFTDGGFELFQLPIDPIQRLYGISGGPEAIHVIGDEGSINNVSSAFFFSLIPRTR